MHILWILLGIALASRGDELEQFRRCNEELGRTRCAPDGIEYADGPLPAHLRALQWTCKSDVDYACQQAITAYLVQHDLPIEQFHGKWPFVRVLGIQEPASVVFSIWNGMVHYYGLRLIRKISHPMKPYYLLFSFVGMNAWIWSTVFHIRDFPSTEKLDYFSAGAYVLYGFFYACLRVFGLYKSTTSIVVLALLCSAALAAHIYYLTFIIFDYGYNMLANVVVGSIHGLIWVYYSFTTSGPFWTWWPAIIVLALSGAMSLELFDFPPFLYAIDAHSLWHLSTIPITWVWYRFLIRDAAWDRQLKQRQL